MFTSSVSESNDNLIGFIASTVEKLSDDMATMRDAMVTTNVFEAGISAVRGDIEQVQLRLVSCVWIASSMACLQVRARRR